MQWRLGSFRRRTYLASLFLLPRDLMISFVGFHLKGTLMGRMIGEKAWRMPIEEEISIFFRTWVALLINCGH